MPHFVYDNTNLDFPKTDAVPIPPGADATQYIQATDWNNTCQAVVDLKTLLRGATFYGLATNASDPNPGLTNYLWLSNAGVLTLRLGASTLPLVAATRQVLAGAGLTGGGTLASDQTISLPGLSSAGTYSNPSITVDAYGRITAAASSALSIGIFATGTITCVAKASLVDTDYITIGDGINAAKLYEFDVAGNGVTATRVQVNVSSDTTAAQVAARLKTAIEANHPVFTVVDNGAGVLTLTHKLIGIVGNVAMTENVANAGFTVAGLSGGVNPS